jgi:hypothetical protein
MMGVVEYTQIRMGGGEKVLSQSWLRHKWGQKVSAGEEQNEKLC